MICRHIRLVTFTLACLFLSRELYGAVVERDLHLAGDGLVTFDTVSGREWLDVTETYELSVAELNELLQAGGPLAGFVGASRDDVESYLTSAGFDPSQMPGDQDYDLAVAFIDLVGGLHATGGLIEDFRYTSGRYATAEGIVGDDSLHVHAFGAKPVPGSAGPPLLFITYGAGIDNNPVFPTLPPLGYWLYRLAPVPEPSAGMIAVGAILALGLGFRRRRERPFVVQAVPVQRAILSIAVFVALVTPRLSEGAVVERDLHSAGDGLLTYDTVSGREWLDLTATPPVTLAQIQASWGTGGQRELFGGFEIAQYEDVFELAHSAGISPDAMGSQPARPANSSEIEAAFRLAELVCGEACHFDAGILAQGSVGFLSLYENNSVTVTAWTTHPPFRNGPGGGVYGQYYSSSIEGPDWYMENLRNSPLSYLWLYRAAVPEPAVAGLLLPILFAWLGLRRRGLARS